MDNNVDNPNSLSNDNKTNEFTIKSGHTTVKVVEHFEGNCTYSDIIKAALRREFAQ